MINHNQNKYAEALKEEIIKDLVDARHINISVTFHRGSSKDKMKSKKHATMIHQTRKDIVIKSDTIRLIRVLGSQLANVVRATIKNVLQTFGYERQWKVNITNDGAATIVAACEDGLVS